VTGTMGVRPEGVEVSTELDELVSEVIEELEELEEDEVVVMVEVALGERRVELVEVVVLVEMEVEEEVLVSCPG